MLEERVEFERALDRNPCDWALRAVYADYLEASYPAGAWEQELAIAQRWMSVRSRSAYTSVRKDSWAWWGFSITDETSDHSELPHQLLKAMEAVAHGSTYLARFLTRSQAESKLADVIHLLTEDHWNPKIPLNPPALKLGRPLGESGDRLFVVPQRPRQHSVRGLNAKPILQRRGRRSR